nr:PREDICTED: epidermal growth factor receptor kinase substrate 8-like protein 3 [Struthio camelus australis]
MSQKSKIIIIIIIKKESEGKTPACLINKSHVAGAGHLLTMRLEQDIRSTDDCIARLKALEAQGRVWGQDLMLQVREQALVLSDMESKGKRRWEGWEEDRPEKTSSRDHLPSPDSQQTAWLDAQNQPLSDMERDTEVLNHVLGDVELFVHRLRAALSSASSKNLWKKKKKIKGKNLPPEADYRDFFQKVKYALNLMGKLRGNVEKPSIPELLHLLFTTLSFVLGHCPNSSLAPSVESPLLIQAAVDLLEDTLHQQDYSTWKNLGIAWNKTRAEYPDGDSVPAYTPVFSDGWLPPSLAQPNALLLPSQGRPVLMQAMYEFRGRNAQELTVQKGDTLQVLDQRKKWYLVQNSQGEKGYIPSNILEPLGQDSMSQGSPPSLHPGSTPAEVTAWLKDKGFSQITVKCLGVLSGHQLLHMSPEELRAVCPEEWRRIIFKLSAVKTSLGIGPRD